MAKPKISGLGKGLDAIFNENSVDESGGITMLRLSDIEPNPDQPRREFDAEALNQLAQSIAAHGLIQPIVVRSAGASGYYQIIAGERRWRASKMAGLTEVPVIVMELDDIKAAQIAIIENVQREDLNPIEEANAYRSLIDGYGMTQEMISRQVGKSRSAIANSLRLLDLPEEVASLVRSGKLSAGHARTLLGLNDRSKLAFVAKVVSAKKFSVRQTESLVRLQNKAPSSRKKPPSPAGDGVDYTAELAKKLTSRIGHRVNIVKTGKINKLEIEFSDDGDLDGIVSELFGDSVFDG